MPRRRSPTKSPARPPTGSTTETEVRDRASGAETKSLPQGCSPLRAQGPTVSLPPAHRASNSGDDERARFSLNAPDDAYEREAERVAEAVMHRRLPEMSGGVGTIRGEDHIQRMCARCRRRHRQGKRLNCEECEEEIGEGNTGPRGGRDDVRRAAAIATRSGRPLPESTRVFFERRMGRDFGDVRIHTGTAADRAAQSIDARAFTIGTDIAFAENRYDPGSAQGRRLLAHELTHVVQQRRGAQSTNIRRQTDDDEKSGADGRTSETSGGTSKKNAEKGIDARVDAFVEDLNRQLKAIRQTYKRARQRSKSIVAGASRLGAGASDASSEKQAGNGGSTAPKSTSVPTLRVKKKAGSRSLRTPEEQAQGVVKGTSWTCRSAHLAGNARHVWLLMDGSISWNPVRDLKKKFNESVYTKFVAAWSSLMAKHGLKNYKGKEGWAPGDAYHLELPGGRVSGDILMRCVREYVRLTREEGQDRNEEFERYYTAEIRTVEREAFQKAGGAVTEALHEARTTSPRAD